MVKPGAAVYMLYVEQFGAGEVLSRVDVAERMGVHYTTARYHLERAVKNDVLHKQVVWIGNQTGWGYALPETMPKLKFAEAS